MIFSLAVLGPKKSRYCHRPEVFGVVAFIRVGLTNLNIGHIFVLVGYDFQNVAHTCIVEFWHQLAMLLFTIIARGFISLTLLSTVSTDVFAGKHLVAE